MNENAFRTVSAIEQQSHTYNVFESSTGAAENKVRFFARQ